MPQEPQQPQVIKDDNENKLAESSTSDTSAESVSTEANTVISPDVTPDSVSTNLDSTEYKEDFQSSDQSVPPTVEEDQSQPVVAAPVVAAPVETPPLTVDLPVKTNVVKTENKTQKQYDIIINQANNLRRQFTKKRKTMSTWDDNKKHEWRTKISDTLIAIIRQSKNKHTLKQHHGKINSMRNLFNHYLNSLSTSKQSNQHKKNKSEKKSEKPKKEFRK